MTQDEQSATVARARLAGDTPGIETSIPAIPARVCAGLLWLLEAMAYAQDVAADPWEFSVTWAELRQLGLASSDGRWLIRKGLVQQAHETTSADDAKRTFVACKGSTLSAHTCFILTEHGLQLARQIAASQLKPSSGPIGLDGAPSPSADRQETRVRPVWDSVRRELRAGGRIIKQFKVPAPSQELVLAAFEEEDWPPRIDDPLPPIPGVPPPRRLHETINALNRSQRHRLLRFSADGLGKGVRWRLMEDSDVVA